MSIRHHRKKRPELVRQQVLDVAARLAMEKGLPALTLDAVAQAAGVSKGGLLHHYPSKMALVDGLYADLVARFDAAIDAEIRQDPRPQGRFSRAYLKVVARLKDQPAEASQWGGLTMALLTEPHLRARWRQWVDDRSAEYVGTDSSVDAQIVRLAADGLWYADLFGSHDMDAEARRCLLERLDELTR